jgi:hypothetical protein
VFARTTKRLSVDRESLLSLVLLPAFFLGTLPQTVCICADGHREAACPAIQRRLAVGTCCQFQDAPSKRSCCGPKPCCGAQGLHHSSSSGCGIAAQTSSCCQPVIEVPIPAIGTKKADTSAQLAMTAAVEPLSSLLLASELWPTLAAPTQSTPPPLDAVITFLRLTI